MVLEPEDYRSRARRDEIEARLLAAADKLLGEGESYTEISVERLASEADLSRSTFYVYFEDKGDLLRAWLAQIRTQVAAVANPWWAMGAQSTRADLREALAGIVTTYRPHARTMAAIFDAASYDPLVREQVDELMRGYIATLRAHIEEGQAGGFIGAGLRPDETASWLMWMAERGQHQMVGPAPPDTELGPIIDSFTDIVWHTLYAPAQS